MTQPTPGSVPVYFPPKLWGELATIADERGVKIPDLIVASVAKITTTLSFEAQIEMFVKAGYPDAVIAKETGQLLHRVQRAMGLSPNRLRRGAGREPVVMPRG